jgi:hypothetical protein
VPSRWPRRRGRLSREIEVVRREEREDERTRLSEVAAKFEEVAPTIRQMDVDRL